VQKTLTAVLLAASRDCRGQSHATTPMTPPAAARQIAARVATLRVPPEFGIAGPDIQAELESCLALARSTQTMVASGERLAAARAAVDLVRAYDRVLDNIRLVPLSIPEQQRVRDQLAPVKDLLRKYRLR
jgi:hypothetical protein